MRSEFMARLTSTDPEARMPYHGPPLPPQQIALLRRWIKEGAKWQDYWAFVPPTPQPLPQVKRADWVRQPLDRFILARLEKEGLEPSPEADKASLVAPGIFRPYRTAAHPSRKKRRIWRTHRPAPTKNRWIVCWLHRATANAGLRCGWTWRATPTPRDTKRM